MSTSFLKSPKEEEQENSTTQSSHSAKEAYVKEELEGFLGIGDEENLSNDDTYGEPSWDFIDWEEQQLDGEEYDQDGGENKGVDFISNFFEEESQCLSRGKVIKSEINLGFWDGEDQKGCLKLNLNYQDVLDAWSDRGHLCAQGYSFSLAGSGYYSGEVPVMEEERTSRREASVLRYKEKRQTRFFAKKIRYQVRKLNADKRPRLKGRFVKRTS